MNEKNILNNFKDILGEYCAINQFIELSKRCFVIDHTAELKSRDTFVTLAAKNAVTLTSYNSEEMVNTISRSYIVNIHLCFETFLKDVCKQVKEFGLYSYQDRLQTESWLKCAFKNIVHDKIPSDKQALYELCEYYRLVRNTAVHDLCDIDSHEKEYRKIQKNNYKTEAKFSKLSAPNDYDNISFDDFVMFSRSCVELATYLFDMLSYDYERIVKNMPSSLVCKFRRYSKSRCEKALIAYINTCFKLDDSLYGQIPYLVNLIIAR